MQEEDIAKVLDYLVYAPVGIITSVAESLPKAVENGRSIVESRTMVAKFMGKMAVDYTGNKVKTQVEDIRRSVTDGITSVLPEPWGDLARFILGNDSTPGGSSSTSNDGGFYSDVPSSEPDRTTTVEAEASEKTTVLADLTESDESGAGDLDAKSRPLAPVNDVNVADVSNGEIDVIIPNYQTLSANQIVARFDLLSPSELDLVVRFETEHRGRKTIVARAQKLLGEQP
ncbi:hypothetical protein [Acidithrix ferrooxidans]|uniref:Uncharacterized protein n=1 Tax=Acidithrix ferrooxidans TaxID=1280514 RepID=A0A0D8HM13_9ACTN|nr:hypothetical protein [Acidithrix ferrooxidans]KJF18141.1 hypothetical protein AXFE_10420 [Acidithrix ferrooxidans]